MSADLCPMTHNAMRCQRAELRAEIDRLRGDKLALLDRIERMADTIERQDAENERLTATLQAARKQCLSGLSHTWIDQTLRKALASKEGEWTR